MLSSYFVFMGLVVLGDCGGGGLGFLFWLVGL